MIKEIKDKLSRYTWKEMLTVGGVMMMTLLLTKVAVTAVLVLFIGIVLCSATLLSAYIVIVAMLVSKEAYLLLTTGVGTGLSPNDLSVYNIFDLVKKFLGR